MQSNKNSKSSTQLKREIKKAALNNYHNFFAGLKLYSAAKIPEWKPKAEVIWQEGSTRILNYASKGVARGAKKILFLPPLINRANILDLSGNKSLMRFLAEQGYQPLLVDWGRPGESEKDFDSDAYVNRLSKFCENQKKLVIGGYCMGGVIALKLAERVKPKALILLATPWNFHAPEIKRVHVPPNAMEEILNGFEFVPQEFIQSLFINIDMWRVYNKYTKFPTLSERQKPLVMEVEYWANAGVAMPVKLAKECIIGWAIKNTTGRNVWMDVRNLTMPIFIGCPTVDKIVPVSCSLPLLGLLPNSDLYKFDCGHIGMLTHRLCFEPLKDWLIKNI